MSAGSGVRLAVERADTAPSLALQRAFFAEIASRYPGWDPDVGPSVDANELCPPSGGWVVAYVDNEPVGCGGFKAVDEETVEIRRVFLSPTARGQGLGRLMLRELEAQAGARGYRRARLTTGNRQPEALGLFRSVGYVEIEDFNGYPYASYWMAKDLSG